jgi:hypothetical protein
VVHPRFGRSVKVMAPSSVQSRSGGVVEAASSATVRATIGTRCNSFRGHSPKAQRTDRLRSPSMLEPEGRVRSLETSLSGLEII